MAHYLDPVIIIIITILTIAHLSLGSDSLSLGFAELPDSTTSPQLKANPEVQSMIMTTMRIMVMVVIMIMAGTAQGQH